MSIDATTKIEQNTDSQEPTPTTIQPPETTEQSSLDEDWVEEEFKIIRHRFEQSRLSREKTNEAVKGMADAILKISRKYDELTDELDARFQKMAFLPDQIIKITAAQDTMSKLLEARRLDFEAKLTALQEKTSQDLKTLDEKLGSSDPHATMVDFDQRLSQIEQDNQAAKAHLMNTDRTLDEHKVQFGNLVEEVEKVLASLPKAFTKYLLIAVVTLSVISVTLFCVAMWHQPSQPSSKGAPPTQQTYTKAIDFSGGSKKIP